MTENLKSYAQKNDRTAHPGAQKPLIFFSDVHLGAPLLKDDLKREQKLIRFLESTLQEDSAVFIVGDLFEFWFEYREVVPRKHFRLLSALHRFALDGREIHYLIGNHDLWADSFFNDEIGISVHKKPLEIAAHGFNIFLSHGDGLAKSDKKYRFLKGVLQNKVNIKLYRWVHPDIGIPFAKRRSQESRHKGAKPDILSQEYREVAEGKFNEGFNVFIMGHTHKAIHEINAGNHYINLGDWINHFSFCRIENGEIGLYQWPSNRIYVRPQGVAANEKVTE